MCGGGLAGGAFKSAPDDVSGIVRRKKESVGLQV